MEEVVSGALQMTERFEALAGQAERMEQRILRRDEQIGLTEQAMALRWPEPCQSGMPASQLLTTRRPEDFDDSLFTILNRVQLCCAKHNCTWIGVGDGVSRSLPLSSYPYRPVGASFS